jgi:nucleoside-triphosphatase THEP1
MLHILTGDIQIGKTRWLKRRIEALAEQGVVCYGVISPGIWLEHPSLDGSVQYEKTGIEAMLLPQGRKLPFAKRRDLAQGSASLGSVSQSSVAGLGWVIADKSIAAVNAHFDWIAAVAANDATADVVVDAAAAAGAVAAAGAAVDQPAAAASEATAAAVAPGQPVTSTKIADDQQGLLVIDELGRLELMHGCGFSSAVRLLKQGPTHLYADALVVVRDTLAELVEQRFASHWGTVKWLSPE